MSAAVRFFDVGPFQHLGSVHNQRQFSALSRSIYAGLFDLFYSGHIGCLTDPVR